ncbi:MAG TPA: TonB family protein [Thermoanaerobaculia bacterium]|nr:TonB family protein [Thermoanaerobaculia bacterium]
MFETSVVRAQAQTRSRVSLLSASLVAHSAVILGALAMSIASVDFPIESPKEYSLAPIPFVARIPPPLGTPNGGAKPKAQVAAPVKPVTVPTEPTAPPTVPDTVTPMTSDAAASQSTTATGDGTDEGDVGVPWGVKNSIGDLDAPPVPLDVPIAAQPEAKIYQPHEVQAPKLISKVDPRYPQSLMRAAMPGTVVVRCVIDRNGNLRDPEVITSTMPPFEAEVLRVIGQWRYKPATYGGKPVDSYLDLKVTFQVRR